MYWAQCLYTRNTVNAQKHKHPMNVTEPRNVDRDVAGRSNVLLCIHLKTGFTSLLLQQETRLWKRTLIVVHLLSEPTVNSEWRTNCWLSLTLDVTNGTGTVLPNTRVYVWPLTPSSRESQEFPAGVFAIMGDILSFLWDFREGREVLKCWAENTWR